MQNKNKLPTDPQALKAWLECNSKNERWSPTERELRMQFPLTKSLILLKKKTKKINQHQKFNG
ncbi:MAG: hypothetical protein K9L60_10095 [Methylovulum sp.]|nr:hypothetical protein [Methylovulum sp.]MCF7999439.1 hypothetical protein [Methylovulum sp.]